MLLKEEIISTVFLKTIMISGSICNGLKIILEETHWRYGQIDGELDPILSQDCPLVKETRDWLEYLKEKDDRTMIDEVRSSTRTGRACEMIVSQVEQSGCLGDNWRLYPARKAFQEINSRCPY